MCCYFIYLSMLSIYLLSVKAMKFYHQPEWYTDFLDLLNLFFTFFFVGEFILKFGAFRSNNEKKLIFFENPPITPNRLSKYVHGKKSNLYTKKDVISHFHNLIKSHSQENIIFYLWQYCAFSKLTF